MTSPNAPRLLLERCGGDARALAGATVAAIGPGTAAALRETGIVADVVAERSRGRGAAGGTPGRICTAVRALVARAEEARDTLPDGLRAAGAEVDVVPLYRTLAALPRHPERMLSADAVAFTSSSTVRRFAEALAGRDLSARARRLDRPGHDRDGARARRRRGRRGRAPRPRRIDRTSASGSVGTSRSLTALPLANPQTLHFEWR